MCVNIGIQMGKRIEGMRRTDRVVSIYFFHGDISRKGDGFYSRGPERRGERIGADKGRRSKDAPGYDERLQDDLCRRTGR